MAQRNRPRVGATGWRSRHRFAPLRRKEFIMANKMLIDASHPEETRVVVLRGNRVEEFDFESASKKQLRGNIYLAKVTRVEPSLQAAFVDYGGNRHGFLAFSEIHPDYYQIPVADRQALLEEEARAHRDEDDEDGRPPRRSRRHRERPPTGGEKAGELADEAAAQESGHLEATLETPKVDAENIAQSAEGESFSAPTEYEQENPPEPAGFFERAIAAQAADEDLVVREAARAEERERRAAVGEDRNGEERDSDGEEEFGNERHESHTHGGHEMHPVDSDEGGEEITTLGGEDGEESGPGHRRSDRSRNGKSASEDGEEDGAVEQLGGDAMEEMPNRLPRLRRQYKIQEVIKRRQVLLVQVVKEERGNKGAALTTYLSLAGRYSVLMPNTARGGGISRKITNAVDRKRLKSIAQELEVPEGMGVILRTAGASRTKAEVKRDFEYLLRMWETVRELTLQSTAPSLVYEEGSLIKRAIRDLYNKDIDEVIVAGDDGYREAKDFMRMLMPSHAKNVKPFKDPQPIFAKAGAEAQLDAMFSNQVTLKSGGYIVINQTEALVAIDVNSGRSTREHNIEDTALRTNLEAADEVARQLRLRDLAGLIVVDFIDMEEGRNNRAVERRIKDALKNDRARIQVGRISHFGLLEMSRQRIRTGVLEGSTIACPHCAGAGMVRSTSSIALHVLRVLEDSLIKNSTYDMIVRTRTIVALYILNQKRPHLRELENRFGVTVTVAADDSLTGTTYHALERGELATPTSASRSEETILREAALTVDSVAPPDEEHEAEDDGPEEPVAPESRPSRRPQQRRHQRQPDRQSSERTPGELSAPVGGPERGRDRNGAEASEETGEAEVRRRRRRRRRRGRGGDRDPSGISPNAPQPSDEALAMIAAMGGDLYGRSDDGTDRPASEPREQSLATAATSRPAQRSPVPQDRPASASWAEPGHEPPAQRRPAVLRERPQPPAAAAAPGESESPLAAANQHDANQRDKAADPSEPATPAAAESPPADYEVELDPARPKRTGWWARAKQTFSGD
jgi:ribonuclease E